ncbi:MAG: hypothetical protein KC547_20645, partial [Anaerolineae bacterium]|nr:hypothetical protein [Anaerolineae bacterium]
MPKATGGSTPDSSVRVKKVLEDQMPTHLTGMLGVQCLVEHRSVAGSVSIRDCPRRSPTRWVWFVQESSYGYTVLTSTDLALAITSVR